MYAIRSKYKNDDGCYHYYEGTFEHTSKYSGARHWSAMMPRFTTSVLCALLFATQDDAKAQLDKTCAPSFYKVVELKN